MEDADRIHVVDCTARIVSAYVMRNHTEPERVPELVKTVGASLHELRNPEQAPAVEKERPPPAVPIKQSVQPDYIVCLEDGAKLKMLKRYLRAKFNLTPDDYRRRWGLPADYPMVAPNYSAKRSDFAKASGLGTKTRGFRDVPGSGLAE